MAAPRNAKLPLFPNRLRRFSQCSAHPHEPRLHKSGCRTAFRQPLLIVSTFRRSRGAFACECESGAAAQGKMRSTGMCLHILRATRTRRFPCRHPRPNLQNRLAFGWVLGRGFGLQSRLPIVSLQNKTADTRPAVFIYYATNQIMEGRGAFACECESGAAAAGADG